MIFKGLVNGRRDKKLEDLNFLLRTEIVSRDICQAF
jgi:hypothetical protein